MNKKWFIVSTLFITFLVSGCMNSGKTNAIYLIPEGYTGHALAFYNVKGAQPLTYEGDFAVHEMNEEGYFATSKNDMTYGTVTDQYYFVDENGTRTPIDDRCVRGLGTGGYDSYGDGSSVNLVYTGIDITDDCSDAFRNTTSNFEDGKTQPIMNRVLEKYYSKSNEE
ncbi:DUF6843 domain-containing protein [Sporosarcina sp. NPDC096371]|uniref:DUF6843 domain-containing protein n=1 Tax=Sporosarcina sp. NPDC096371 TaxID=3364530 RepID=UPI00380ECA1A